MATKHIVFDTNTYISYFYNGSIQSIANLVYTGRIIIYTTPRQIDELTSVINRPKIKKKLSLTSDFYTNFVLQIAHLTTIDERFDRLADPNDNYLVDLAYTAKAHYIVSSDRHLASIKHIGKIQILSLSAFKIKFT